MTLSLVKQLYQEALKDLPKTKFREHLINLANESITRSKWVYQWVIIHMKKLMIKKIMKIKKLEKKLSLSSTKINNIIWERYQEY